MSLSLSQEALRILQSDHRRFFQQLFDGADPNRPQVLVLPLEDLIDLKIESCILANPANRKIKKANKRKIAKAFDVAGLGMFTFQLTPDFDLMTLDGHHRLEVLEEAMDKLGPDELEYPVVLEVFPESASPRVRRMRNAGASWNTRDLMTNRDTDFGRNFCSILEDIQKRGIKVQAKLQNQLAYPLFALSPDVMPKKHRNETTYLDIYSNRRKFAGHIDFSGDSKFDLSAADRKQYMEAFEYAQEVLRTLRDSEDDDSIELAGMPVTLGYLVAMRIFRPEALPNHDVMAKRMVAQSHELVDLMGDLTHKEDAAIEDKIVSILKLAYKVPVRAEAA